MPDITRGPNGVARIAPVGSAGPPGTNGTNGTNGSDGAPGLPGVNAVANDTATASYISTPSSATATALSASFALFTRPTIVMDQSTYFGLSDPGDPDDPNTPVYLVRADA